MLQISPLSSAIFLEHSQMLKIIDLALLHLIIGPGTHQAVLLGLKDRDGYVAMQ